MRIRTDDLYIHNVASGGAPYILCGYIQLRTLVNSIITIPRTYTDGSFDRVTLTEGYPLRFLRHGIYNTCVYIEHLGQYIPQCSKIRSFMAIPANHIYEL